MKNKIWTAAAFVLGASMTLLASVPTLAGNWVYGEEVWKYEK